MSTNNPRSFPKLIKIEVDQFESVSMEQEADMKIEMEMVNLVRERDGLKKEVDLLERTHSYILNLVRDREWLKKEVDLLENTQSFTELEKCNLEEKLRRSERRCEELDERIVQMGEKNQKLRQKKMESEKAAQAYKSRVDDLEPRVLKVEAALAKVLNVGLSNLDNFAAAATDGNGGIGLSMKGGRNLAYSETDEDGANVLSLSKPAKSKQRLRYNVVKNAKVRGARCRIGCHCIIKTIDVIKDNLQKENLELFEQSCFGNMLKINKFKYQGNLLQQLLLHMDMSASHKESLIFKFSNSDMEFGPSDFFRITGLCFGKVEARIASSSSIHKDVFQGRSIIIIKDIEEAFLNNSPCHKGKGKYTLKLALLYFLYGTLLCTRSDKRIDMQYLHLIEDLQKFNAFPWGRVAYDLLVSSILQLRLHMDGLEVTSRVARLDIYGFCFALQAWAYEVMPSVAAYCACRVNNFEYITPWILRWSATRIIKSDDLKKFFPLSDKAHSNNTMGKWEELSTDTTLNMATPLNKVKQKKRKFFCYNYQMPHAQPSSAATPPPPSTNAPTYPSHHLARRLSRAEGMLESFLRKHDQPSLDISNDDLPRNGSPLVDDEKDVSSPTLTRHITSGSMNRAADKHAKLEGSFAETKQAGALSELANDRDALGGLKVYVRCRFKAAAV